MKTHLHSLQQTLAGAALGASMACVSVFNESHIINLVLNKINETYTYVPLSFRSGLVLVGVMILMTPEVLERFDRKDS